MTKSNGANGTHTTINPMQALIDAGASVDEVLVMRDLDQMLHAARQRESTDDEIRGAVAMWLESRGLDG